MTNLGERPNSSRGVSARGRRRRDQLIGAGVELLAEGGWPAVTTRAVAERAGANPGLVHYHWDGLPQLRQAIARAAGERVFGPLTAELLAADGVGDLLTRLPSVVSPPSGGAAGAEGAAARLTVELIAGAVRDPALGDVLRDGLAQARGELADWLDTHAPDAPEGTATLLVALVDGLLMHHLLDPAAGVGDAAGALALLAADAGHGGPPRVQEAL